MDFRERFFKDSVRERVVSFVINSWAFFWLIGTEVTRNQHHPPSGSNLFGVYVLVVNIELTSSTWWRFQYLQNSPKDMAQNITYSSWEGTKCL